MSNLRNLLSSPHLDREWLLGLLVALVISAAVWGPVTLPSFDFASTADGEYHLLRLFLVDHSLRAGSVVSPLAARPLHGLRLPTV